MQTADCCRPLFSSYKREKDKNSPIVFFNFCGRHCEQAVVESLPAIVQQLTKLLQSQPMFKLLRTMTGLEMANVPLSDDDDDDDSDDDDGDEGRKVWGEDEGEV